MQRMQRRWVEHVLSKKGRFRVGLEWERDSPGAYGMGHSTFGSGAPGLRELPLLHECAGEDCGWLFLDTSKNHSRRWCDMKSCGNRAKVGKHYEQIRRKQV